MSGKRNKRSVSRSIDWVVRLVKKKNGTKTKSLKFNPKSTAIKNTIAKKR